MVGVIGALCAFLLWTGPVEIVIRPTDGLKPSARVFSHASFAVENPHGAQSITEARLPFATNAIIVSDVAECEQSGFAFVNACFLGSIFQNSHSYDRKILPFFNNDMLVEFDGFFEGRRGRNRGGVAKDYLAARRDHYRCTLSDVQGLEINAGREFVRCGAIQCLEDVGVLYPNVELGSVPRDQVCLRNISAALGLSRRIERGPESEQQQKEFTHAPETLVFGDCGSITSGGGRVPLCRQIPLSARAFLAFLCASLGILGGYCFGRLTFMNDSRARWGVAIATLACVFGAFASLYVLALGRLVVIGGGY